MRFSLTACPRTASDFISCWILPVGFAVLLTGLTWLGDRGQYHKLFYTLLAAPALIAIIMQPQQIALTLRNSIVLAFLALAGWASLSIFWSTTGTHIGSLLKRPVYIFMLFVACTLIAQHCHQRLLQTLQLSALATALIAAYALIDFSNNHFEEARLVGPGALDNPLLSSHIFGFFFVLWLGWLLTETSKLSILALAPLALLAITLLATGSRTPILASALATAWLVVCCQNKRALLTICVSICALTTLWLAYPESLLARGTSYRLDIWSLALERISVHPWIGHGLGSPLSITIPQLNQSFSEPHSFFLGTLYYTGIIGAALWLLMHIFALRACWLQRNRAHFAIVGALIIYGLGAGLAEGGGVLSRPKEHWFLIWIPIALAIAFSTTLKQEPKN